MAEKSDDMIPNIYAGMGAASWEELLATASTPAQVIVLARDFLATLDQKEFARLPERIRPGKLVDTNDVMAYAYELVRQQHDQHPYSDRAVLNLTNKLASFFSKAAVRVSQLEAPHPPTRKTTRLFR